MKIVVIGGGAAGFAAAIAAAEGGAEVIVLDRNRKPLKKLGVTGNGRGNILNAGKPVYFGDAAFAYAVLRHTGYTELTEFFTMLGIPLREESENRVYPAALKASVVQDALALRAQQLHIKIQCMTQTDHLKSVENGWRISGHVFSGDNPKALTKSPFSMTADRVIVACGGAAAPVHGTDGSAYALLTEAGHTCTPLRPALCALKVSKNKLRGLAGKRLRAKLRLVDAKRTTIHTAEGEVLFAEDAVSGIAAMQLARFWQEGTELVLDLRDEMNVGDDIVSYLRNLYAMRKELEAAELLTGVFEKQVARWILREAGIDDLSQPLRLLTSSDIERIAVCIKGVRLRITGTRGFEQAQVTAGGIDAAEFDPETMESRLHKGLYAAGEMLNVDGECGGFNLMFAWASGLTAGRSAAE